MANTKTIDDAETTAARRAEFWRLPPEAMVDRATIAAAFYVSTATMEALAIKGGGPVYTRVGRRALYRKADGLKWAAKVGRTVESTAQLVQGDQREQDRDDANEQVDRVLAHIGGAV